MKPAVFERITKSLIHPAEFAVLMSPNDQPGGFGAVIYCGGYAAGALNILGLWNRFDLCRGGVQGYTVVSSDFGDTPTVLGGTAAVGTGGPGVWSSDLAEGRLLELTDWLATELDVPGPHVIVGGSHGASNALRFAHDFPAKVAGVVGFIGAVDVEDIRSHNRSGYAASITAAFGLATGAAVPDSKNPARMASSWPVDVPVRLWYSDDDPICVAATQTAFAAGATPGADVMATSFGAHSHSTNGLPWADLTDFILGRLEA